MKFSILLAIAGAISFAQAGCSFEGGNQYCSQTNKVIYKGVGFSGSYNDVTDMNEQTGQCSSQPLSFSGNLSPLDEQLSVHFRGPLELTQFGVYYPSSGSSNQKRDDDCDQNIHRHHRHKRATAVVQVTQTVVVDGSGNTYTSEETAPATSSAEPSTTVGGQASSQAGWGAPSGSPAEPSSSSSSSSGSNQGFGSGPSSSEGSSSSSEPSEASSSSSEPSETSSSSGGSDTSGAAGDYERVAYYNSGNSDNITFLNYFGGSGSGTWSSAFGNSLSYANSQANGGSSKAVSLSNDLTIESNVEYIVMSGEQCDDSCGYYRNDIPAYKGFAGKQKIFVFEFKMPSADDNQSFNHDMPAIWLLNAKIPRTLQYGKQSCSCWSSGCGELDLFEVLSDGEDKLISHLHDLQGGNGAYGGGGTQDYFNRPTQNTMKAAVVFDGEDIHILTVDDDFGSSLSSDTVNSWINQSGSVAQI